MRVYNTLTGKKEAFVPHQENKVNMYVCGPTVYNFLHVGNMRTYVVFDTVSRYLKYRGYEVNMVQNFTDVDDKIIQRALEEGISAADVSDKYIEEALVDYNALSICKADHYPRVTEEMDEIIAMVTQLIEAGYAYVSEGHVFFDAHKSKEYGKLSKKNIDDLLSGARVEVSDIKQSPVDFVLWKPAKSGEPFWESPWGQGRPGWHIECSAMSEKYLGQIDIHGGGGDLTFPHHENEIAQSEALGKSPYAKYWMHVGMLTSGHKKMSKSLGNFFTLRELIEIQKIPPVVIRFFLLSGHYRMPMEYSEALLESAQKSLGRIENCWEMLKQVSDDGAETLTEAEAALLKEAESFRVDFEARMDDDFNTADAISIIFELVKFANVHVHGQDASKAFAKGLLVLLDHFCELLGLVIERRINFSRHASLEMQAEVTMQVISTDARIDDLIAQRQEARKNKDWALADKIRDDLAAEGITLEDTPTGVRWTKK